MKESRLAQVLRNMNKTGLTQFALCDPASILYLTGRYIDPGERLYALVLNINGGHKILINDLFTVPEDLGVPKIRFSDTDDAVSLLAGCIDFSKPAGVDKNLPARFLLPLMDKGAHTRFVNASACVDDARACKDEEERKLMRGASRINDAAMGEFVKSIRPGITEQELAAGMEAAYRRLGADGYSFRPLVGFGKNAALGHHEPDSTPLREGDCVLLDVGCRKDGYCADMTRTFFFRGVSEKHREIYELVRKANEAAEAVVKPGTRFCDIDGAARGVIEQAGYGKCFTHRLGHSIGIEVHEPGDVSSSHTDAVKPGMVFSIEPGVYLEGDAGVRIEDLVLVTEDGCEILNRFPKELRIVG